jgi:hypothetical protein
VKKSFVYTGPSWAKRSYDHPKFEELNGTTNLAKEWGIEFIDASKIGSTILQRLAEVKSILEDHPGLPVVWIYGEPLADLTDITDITTAELIQQEDWVSVWNTCNQYCLSQIAELGSKILLIGGHSDIINCKHNNITIGHPSWQKWIAQQAGLTVDKDVVCVKMDDGGDFSFSHCWGAELTHKFMHAHPEIIPSQTIVNAVWDVFFFWKELEKANLFFEVHPNRRATEQFAKFLLPTVKHFLQDNE